MWNRSTFALVLLAAPILTAQAGQQIERVTRVHDIAFLARAVPRHPNPVSWPAVNLRLATQEAQASGGLWGLGKGFPPPDLALRAFGHAEEPEEKEGDASAGVVVSPESLAALIRRNIAEDSWANVRNSIKVDGERLRVVAAPEVHSSIDSLLAALRARRASMAVIEVAVVPAKRLAADAARGPWLTNEAFARAIVDAGSGAQAASLALTAYNEQTASGFAGRVRTAAMGVGINQTGVVPVSDVAIETLPIGLGVEVRPVAVTGTDWFRCDLRVTRSRQPGVVERRKTLFAELELVPQGREDLTTTLLLRAGRPAVAGRFSDRQPDGREREFAILARLTPMETEGEAPASPPVDTAFRRRMLDLSFLLEPFEGERAGLSADSWLRRIRHTVQPEAWLDERADLRLADRRFLHVTAREGTHRALREWLDARIRARARVAAIEVAEYAGSVEAVHAVVASLEDGLYLPDDWESSEAGRRLERSFSSRGFGPLGGTLKARGVDARPFVAEVESISGGTGFSILEIPAPVVRTAGNGFELLATAAPRIDPDMATLELWWTRCRTAFAARSEVLPIVRLTGDEAGAGAGRQAGERTRYVVDLPRQRVKELHATLPLRLGRTAVLGVEQRGAATASLLVARVDVTAAIQSVGAADNASSDARSETSDAREVVRETRTYPVASLLTQPAHGGGVSVSKLDPAFIAFDDDQVVGHGTAWIDGERLVSLIQKLIAPDSWSNTRNALEIDGSHMVVRQTPEVLDRVGAFLADLESRTSRLLRVDVALVPIGALDAAAADWRDAAAPWLAGAMFDRAIVAAGDGAVRLGGLAHAGVPCHLAAADVERHVVESHLCSTGVVPVLNAGVEDVRSGLFGDVRLFRAGALLRIDLDVRRADDASVRERRSTPTGDIELLDRHTTGLRTSLLAPPGGTTVAGYLDVDVSRGDSGAGSKRAPVRVAVLVRASETSASAASPTRTDVPRRVDASALGAPLAEAYSFGRFDWSWLVDEERPISFDVAGEAPAPALIDEAELAAALAAVSREGRWLETEAVRFEPDDAAARRVRAVVDELLRERARLLRVDIRQLSIDRAELARIGGLGARLDDDAARSLRGESVFHVGFTGFAGLPVGIDSWATRSYVAAVERVSGGTGHIIIDVSDVAVDRRGGGVVLDVQADLVPGTPWVQLRLDGAVATHPTFERRIRARSDQMVDAEAASVGKRDEWIEIDLPEQRIEPLRLLATLPLGGSSVLSAASDPGSPARVRVLVVGVREVAVPWPEGDRE